MNELVKLALELRNKGQNTEAIKLFYKALEQNPGDLYTKHNLAAALGDIGEFEESAQIIAEAIKQGLNKPQSWLVYARSLAGSGKLEDAQQAYQQAIKLNPRDLVSHKELSQLLWMATGSSAKALQHLDKAISASPDFIQLSLLKAEVMGQMGDRIGQHRLMKDCYAKTGHDPNMAYLVSKSALSCGKFKEALELAVIAMNLQPNNLHITIHYSNCLLANAQPDVAITYIVEMLKHFPNDQHLLAIQALCWRLLGDSRYAQLYDYKRFVKQLPLGIPTGWETIEDYLDDLETELDAKHRFKEHPFHLSVRHGSQLESITSSGGPAMRAYESAIEEPLNHYMKEVSDKPGHLQSRLTGKAELFSAWSVKLYPGGYHSNHVHQQGWISSACHIRENMSGETANEDPKAGWMKFGEPGPVCKPELPADFYLKPKRGHIVFFPSYVWHGTVSFDGEGDRLTVAADLIPG